MPTLTYSEQLTVTHCWCGIALAVPDNLLRNCRDDNSPSVLYCPLGHAFGWSETEADRLRKKLETKERQLASERARRDPAEAAAEHERNRVRGYQGALGKAKKRAARGVCPAPGCKRSFVDVAKHVATCHPNLVETEVSEANV